jgi:hypothetical protein
MGKKHAVACASIGFLFNFVSFLAGGHGWDREVAGKARFVAALRMKKRTTLSGR